ncbi:FtsP/CotA-like multicopper oxidase with cupredoxin domain [Methylohalomonas lacus]|uniref:FtsP/CotA-like multicopper oxidase with cupredoxin domain n=1 Tax=Methylohalomonas lacus TaxID=398773 RepID=A0AAE3HMD5_9GAMM|nr:copper oxidase [Methylohalomonas lacus]MCS3903794.1 FtsP/CotA-like multicopper oxidase with cupredoxin domain [Methylohalomonas lacus]
MTSRRNLLMSSALGMLGLGLSGHAARAAMDPASGRRRRAGGNTPVKTLNGRSLPYEMKDGVKEFHLVAEEIEHEFAPGCVAKCWGYNGSTPGPTIEAVEGDRVRILVTNNLPEHTTIHWHGILLPSGMDGVGGLSQPHIKPGETYAYEFTLNQHGTHMYHPHADEMVQMAVGLMGMFIIHPKDGDAEPVDRDYCFLLHNWALHPGTYRPDPSIMTEFDLWTFNSKVFPAIDSIVARTGERVRIRMGNLSMWNHPIHLHGHKYQVTGSDGGRWPRAQWRDETTEIVAVGQTRDIEFIANPGDWAFHCHMSHHTMNAMGHDIANTLGVDQSGVAERIQKLLPGYMPMGETGMAEHGRHTAMAKKHAGHHGMQGPRNTLPMMAGEGPFGPIEMGGMFTVVKIRDDLAHDDYSDPGWYNNPQGSVAWKVSG